MQHTNTSSTSSGSTTSLFYRDLGARWLTTRSKKPPPKKDIRRSNKNRMTLSNSPIYGWWRPAWNLSFEGRVRNVALRVGLRSPPPRLGAGGGGWHRRRPWGPAALTEVLRVVRGSHSQGASRFTLVLWVLYRVVVRLLSGYCKVLYDCCMGVVWF